MTANRPQTPPSAVNASTASTPLPEAPVFGQAELQLNDFQYAVRHDPGTQRLLVLGNLGAVGGLIATVALAFQQQLAWAGASAVMALGCLATHQLPDAMALSWYRKTSAANRRLRFTINNQGIIVVSQSSPRLYAWRQLYWARSTERSWLVWVSPKHFLILPHRAFATTERQLVSMAIASHLPPAQSEPLQWKRWTVLTAAGVLAWLAWDSLVPR